MLADLDIRLSACCIGLLLSLFHSTAPASASDGLERERGVRDVDAPCELWTSIDASGLVPIIEQTGEAVLHCRNDRLPLQLFNTQTRRFRPVDQVCGNDALIRRQVRAIDPRMRYQPSRLNEIMLDRVFVTPAGDLVYTCSLEAYRGGISKDERPEEAEAFLVIAVHRAGQFDRPEIGLVEVPAQSLRTVPLGYDPVRQGITLSSVLQGRDPLQAFAPLRPGEIARPVYEDAAQLWLCPRHRMITCDGRRSYSLPASDDQLVIYSISFNRLPTGRFTQRGEQFLQPDHQYYDLQAGYVVARVADLNGPNPSLVWRYSLGNSLAYSRGLSAERYLTLDGWDSGRNQAAAVLDLDSGQATIIQTSGRAMGGYHTAALSWDGRYAVVRRYDRRVLVFDIEAGAAVLQTDDAVDRRRAPRQREVYFVGPNNRLFSMRSDEIAYLGTFAD